MECKFGFVGKDDAKKGRICVPYEADTNADCPADCGSLDQKPCDGALLHNFLAC